MMLSGLNYAASFFKFKRPTPIQGTPTKKTLKWLNAKFRANASSIETDLGLGDYNYLGLVLSGTEYQLIKPTPQKFDALLFPGPLIFREQRAR